MKLINISFVRTEMPFGNATVLRLGDNKRFKNVLVKKPHLKHYNISKTKQYKLCFVGEKHPSDGWIIKLSGREIFAKEEYTKSFLKVANHRYSDIRKRDVICICNIYPVTFYESRSDGRFTAYHIENKDSYTVSIVDDPRSQTKKLIRLTHDSVDFWNLESYKIRVFMHSFTPNNPNEEVSKILYPIQFSRTFELTKDFGREIEEPADEKTIYWIQSTDNFKVNKEGMIVGVPNVKYTAYDQLFPSNKIDKSMTVGIAQKIANHYFSIIHPGKHPKL
ncbi:hypothetical protein HXA34_20635 [Salipaludibacillus agaradhaerens]|jgi:hypothetical protein|uniref:hypothetical protein n=1 Tax=Salipaludibacillus agaradhaerens TaxID=76935 RepID=UPI002151A940|nr:hypothetical protein [Salipaludibacillus agaradhaerens]MCR6108707.1 hypothetical protein [Salipaludibacillus agaradhaerens]MCR6120730.1 hypothetical protein [Salipaludibacillus agaradhaerens]